MQLFTDLPLQLGGGAILGFIVGYAVKKLSKLALIIGGILIAFALFLESKGYIVVEWQAVAELPTKIIPAFKEGVSLITGLALSLPFAGSFLAGFALGLKVA
ncbi:MAG: FUN14 domain-containing protein [Methermicoccaceae archaeon]